MSKKTLQIIINNRIKSNLDATFQYNELGISGELVLIFKNIHEYIKFLQNPIIRKKLFEDYFLDDDVEKRINEYIIDGFVKWSRSDNFINHLKSTKPVIYINRIRDMDYDILSENVPIVLDIRSLPFSDKLEIITHPKMNDNIYFLDEYTELEEVPFQELLDMYSNMLKIVTRIKEKSYSPLESLFYIYNELKNKQYCEESAYQSYIDSRSLNQVMRGNSIVCVGFTNYFLAVANILGLDAERIDWNPEEGYDHGHSSVIVFVNDPKYQQVGIWSIDTTWDSKKNDYDEDYKNNLRHFLMPLDLDVKEKEKHHLINPQRNCYHDIFKTKDRHEVLKSLDAPMVMLEDSKRLIIRKIITLYKKLGLPLPKCDDIDILMEQIKILANQILPLTTLESIIMTVSPKNEDELETALESNYNFLLLPREKKQVVRLMRFLGIKDMY